MENYICINGKKAELTEEQLKALGIESPKANPFARVQKGDRYYCIEALGNVCAYTEDYYGIDEQAYDNANYCTDKAILEQRALHETLNRLLWRYSMQNDGDKIEWHSDPHQNRTKAFIYYNHIENKFEIHTRWDCQFFGCVWFNTYEIAQSAIKEVLEPFIKAHPDFKF